MAKQVINTGTVPDDGTGDNLRNAFVKVNANFTELYDYNANTSNSGALSGGIVTGVLDSPSVGAHKLRFYFEALTDLPNASTYHGMFAHVHATGKAYFAHGGQWVELANDADVPTVLTDLGISDGSSGQVLTTNGSGTFTFGSVQGLVARGSLSGTTSSLANNASGDLDITGYKGYALMAIQTDRAAWVRVYSHGSARSADASRTQTTDPTPGSGVIAEVITGGAEIIQISPGAFGYSFEATPNTTIPCRVTNLSGSTSTVAVTLTALQLEG